MSVATALNLAIAMVEERPAAMRRVLGNVSLEEMREVGEAQKRLMKAIDRYAARVAYKTIRSVALRSMMIYPSTYVDRRGDSTCPPVQEESDQDMLVKFEQAYPSSKDGFIAGVAAVEQLIDDAMQALDEQQ